MNVIDRSKRRQAWRSSAACADPEMSPDRRVFFPPNEASPGACEAAKSVCAQCPVAGDCLWLALVERAPDGIFGGLTSPERRYLLERTPGLAIALRVIYVADQLPDWITHHDMATMSIGAGSHQLRPVWAIRQPPRGGRVRGGRWIKDELMAWALSLVATWSQSDDCPHGLAERVRRELERFPHVAVCA
ncbi:MAG: WhiB family transcriptional regulator [Candidatus Nanopelagicales bacterium]